MQRVRELHQALSCGSYSRARGEGHIIETRCIDCGECVRICSNQAKVVLANCLDNLKRF